MRAHTRSLRFPTAMLSALILSGCDAAPAHPLYIGKAYSGRMEAAIATSDLPITKRQYGSATAEFKRTAPGKARLAVNGNIRGRSAGFSIEGSYDKSGFRGRDDSIELTIDAAGKVNGHGTDKGSHYRFSGTISATDMALTVQWRPAAGAPPSTLEGIDFTYSLEDDAVENDDAKKAPTDENGKPCTRTRVEQRVFPSLDGGPMSMGMVVVCDN